MSNRLINSSPSHCSRLKSIDTCRTRPSVCTRGSVYKKPVRCLVWKNREFLRSTAAAAARLAVSQSAYDLTESVKISAVVPAAGRSSVRLALCRRQGRKEWRREGMKERLLKLELRSDSKSNPFQDISSAVGEMCWQYITTVTQTVINVRENLLSLSLII